MKKIRLAAFLAVFLAVTAGCGNANESNAGGFTPNDLYLNIADTSYRVDEKIEPVIANLGSGYDYAEGKSCAYDSVDKTFSYAFASFYTNPREEGDIISEIYTESEEVTTSKGVSVGAAKEDVVTAHGDGFEDMGNMLVYRVPGSDGEAGRGALCFEMENNTVIAIFITTEPI